MVCEIALAGDHLANGLRCVSLQPPEKPGTRCVPTLRTWLQLTARILQNVMLAFWRLCGRRLVATSEESCRPPSGEFWPVSFRRAVSGVSSNDSRTSSPLFPQAHWSGGGSECQTCGVSAAGLFGIASPSMVAETTLPGFQRFCSRPLGV